MGQTSIKNEKKEIEGLEISMSPGTSGLSSQAKVTCAPRETCSLRRPLGLQATLLQGLRPVSPTARARGRGAGGLGRHLQQLRWTLGTPGAPGPAQRQDVLSSCRFLPELPLQAATTFPVRPLSLYRWAWLSPADTGGNSLRGQQPRALLPL